MCDITAGVLQGDTLAPFLFITVLDDTLRRAMGGRTDELLFTITLTKSRRHQTEVLADLDFADDIALLPNGIKEVLHELFQRVETECKKRRLGLNGTPNHQVSAP